MAQHALASIERFEAIMNRLIRSLAARSGGDTGLSPSQRIVLQVLSQGPLQVSEVAARLGVTLSAATGLVDRMAKGHLVVRERDRADRRVVWVKLTPEGERVLAEVKERRIGLLREMLSPLTPDEVEQLCHLLDRLKLDR